MFTFNPTRHSTIILAVALALSATGCSSTRDGAGLSSLRKLIPSTRSDGFPATTVRHAVAVQRHAREHALTSIRTVQTIHHGAPRSL